jgi:diguanylate cyclase (GGDEF)-like protein/PAS domain S-box-containing protein
VSELHCVQRERDEALNDAHLSSSLADKVFESVVEGIIVTDRHGKIERVNEAFTRLTGYTEKEALGRDPSLLNSGHQDPAFYKEMWRALVTEGHWQGEIWNRRKNGELYLEYLTITRVLDQNGVVANYAGIFSDITHRRQTEERLRYLSTHDVLTGLANRALFEERLERAIVHAQRTGGKFAIAYLDLDGLKLVNETFGYQTGDDVLKVVAQRLREAIGQRSTIARLGGDEFGVILEEFNSLRDVGQVTRTMLDAVNRPVHLDGHEIFITSCLGISTWPDDGSHAADLMICADQAMYGAKSRGRGVFQFFERQMTSAAMAQLETLGELHRALEKNEFCLFYQPQYALATRHIVGMEALLRWRHPERGLVPPGDFIAIIEQSALVIPLGRWVLREACKQARRWLDAGLEFGRVAVNVSARQFLDEGFLGDLAATLDETGLPPERLQLELLESMAMNTREEIGTLLHQLVERRVSLAIDDFGTGYSSLAYLKDLPVDTLKIDRSFLAGSDAHNPDRAIIRAVVAMGRALNLDVVMEGVETEEQLAFLQEAGCNQVQGYLLAKPQPAEQITACLSRSDYR